MSDPARPSWLPRVDLRPVTRDSQLVQTRILVAHDGSFFEWLVFGSLSRAGLDRRDGQWISASAEGVLDESHDPVMALWIDVVGIQLESIQRERTTLSAWIAGTDEDSESIKVLSPDDLGSLRPCPDCVGKEMHRLGDYLPEPNVELWRKLRGAKIHIVMGPKLPS